MANCPTESELPHLIQAMRLIDNGTRTRLTHRGNAILSRHAPRLRALGLIVEAPGRWIAYAPTAAGRKFITDHECVATGLGSVL